MKVFFRVLFFPLALLRFVLLILVSLFFLCSILIEDKIAQRRGTFNFWTAQHWGKTAVFILGLKVKRDQRPLLDKYLLMPNHRSYLDIFLMAAYSPSAFVAKAELRSWPILGLALKAGRAILVNRKELKSLLETMGKIKHSIENNISITIFPEGTTNKGPGLNTFKKGTFKIASELQIPIVPCAIEYHNKHLAWTGDENFIGHFFRELWNPVSRVSIQFGEPIQGDDFVELIQKTKISIEKMLVDLQVRN